MRALKSRRLVASPVEIEVFFVAAARVSYERAVQMFALLLTPAFQIITLTAEDHQRMVALMRQYGDAELDFADVAQIAIAERLNVSQIYTFDRRDFGLVRPRHIAYFELLP